MTLEYHERVEALRQRLTDVNASVERSLQRRQDDLVIAALKHGTATSEQLDYLFDVIKEPLRFSVIAAVAVCRFIDVDADHLDPSWDDVFHLGVSVLALRWKMPRNTDPPLPPMGLLEQEDWSSNEYHLAPVGNAQLGLLRRLVRAERLDEIERVVQRFADWMKNRVGDLYFPIPRARDEEEVARWLRLVAPIERDERRTPILTFLSPTGRNVTSTIIHGRQADPKYYMGVDK